MDPDFYNEFNGVRAHHPLDASDAELGTEWHVDDPAPISHGTSTGKICAMQPVSKGTAKPSSGGIPGRLNDTDGLAFPIPSLPIPIPRLDYDLRIFVSLAPRVSVGMTSSGHRDWTSSIGGTWSGSFGFGKVMPGGQDSQTITPNGSARIESNHLLQTTEDTPAFIVVKMQGWCTGPAHVLEALADPQRTGSVHPREYSYRVSISLETGDSRYADINHGMWIASGMPRETEVVYDAYRIS